MVYIYVLTGYYAAQAPSDGLNRASNTVKLCDPSNIGMWYGPALFAFEGMGSGERGGARERCVRAWDERAHARHV
eukprot:714043-Prymnesium_polylepis.1